VWGVREARESESTIKRHLDGKWSFEREITPIDYLTVKKKMEEIEFDQPVPRFPLPNPQNAIFVFSYTRKAHPRPRKESSGQQKGDRRGPRSSCSPIA
jgi:hypothetical protein